MQGKGIGIVDKFESIPQHPEESKSFVVDQYIDSPHLINGHKYDLRLYLLVTSMKPLRMYLFNNGFIRKASEKYELNSSNLDDVYRHLTNAAINVKNPNLLQHENDWTLPDLWKYLESKGIDKEQIWKRIKGTKNCYIIITLNNNPEFFRYPCKDHNNGKWKGKANWNST